MWVGYLPRWWGIGEMTGAGLGRRGGGVIIRGGTFLIRGGSRCEGVPVVVAESLTVLCDCAVGGVERSEGTGALAAQSSLRVDEVVGVERSDGTGALAAQSSLRDDG